MTSKEQFINTLIQRHQQNALITLKHDPYKVELYTRNDYRTVISYEIADDPIAMLRDGQFNIEAYQNNLYPQSPEYYAIKPFNYTITASGATATTIHSNTKNNLVIVNGLEVGLHMFGESDGKINWKLNNGQLTSLGLLL